MKEERNWSDVYQKCGGVDEILIIKYKVQSYDTGSLSLGRRP